MEFFEKQLAQFTQKARNNKIELNFFNVLFTVFIFLIEKERKQEQLSASFNRID
jgi:hypothetical protein